MKESSSCNIILLAARSELALGFCDRPLRLSLQVSLARSAFLTTNCEAFYSSSGSFRCCEGIQKHTVLTASGQRHVFSGCLSSSDTQQRGPPPCRVIPTGVRTEAHTDGSVKRDSHLVTNKRRLQALLMTNYLDEAIKFCKEALRLNPDGADAKVRFPAPLNSTKRHPVTCSAPLSHTCIRLAASLQAGEEGGT